MGKYHFRSEQFNRPLKPKEVGLQFTSVERMVFSGTQNISSNSEELCLVCLSESVEYGFGDSQGIARYKDMLYLPRHQCIHLTSTNKTEIIKYGAPAHLDTKFAHISFTEIDACPRRHKIYGDNNTNCLRDVWNYIDDEFGASRFLIGICRGRTGGWTAWPPHEHAEKREEVYVYFGMDNNFGLQCIYEDLESSPTVYVVQDGDLVSIPAGYHPNVAAPMGSIQYIFCMVSRFAGEREFMDLHIQPGFGNGF